MVHKHDWVTGLLCEIERYCASNGLNRLAFDLSHAISTATEEIEVMESNSNVIYLSEYEDRKVLDVAKSILLAYTWQVEDVNGPLVFARHPAVSAEVVPLF